MRGFLVFLAFVCFSDENFQNDVQLDEQIDNEPEEIDVDDEFHAPNSKESNNTLAASARWNNGWDGELKFHCPSSQTITSFYSVHDNKREDRLFDIKCSNSPVRSSGKCFWTKMNPWDQPYRYTCPNNGMVSGMYSIHSNRHEDRRWAIQCCEISKELQPDRCRWTGWANNWDGPVNYKVPLGRVLSGFYSIHHNKHEDRLFNFYECFTKKCTIIEVHLDGAPRARHIGRKVLDMSTITNCNPSSQTQNFKFSKSITQSATISRMQTFNYEVSTSIKVTAGVAIKKIFNLGGELSTTITSGSTFSTSRTKTTTVQSQFSRDLSFNLLSKSFGLSIAYADEYQYDQQYVNARYKINCGGHISYRNDRVLIKMHTYQHFKLHSESNKFQCTVQEIGCVHGVQGSSVLQNMGKLIQDFRKCSSGSVSGCKGGNWSCCTNTNKCGDGEGDCDYDSHCKSGLVCGTNNCEGSNFLTGEDCCTRP